MVKTFKSNALRMLDKAKISYKLFEYEYDEDDLSGRHILEQVDLDPQMIFKTIVLRSDQKDYLVCCLPVLQEIDLKKLAKASHHKSVEMIHVKELLSLTGYIRGGCSPIGMKKRFPTYIDQEANHHEMISVSAGARGHSMIVARQDLINYLDATIVDITRS